MWFSGNEWYFKLQLRVPLSPAEISLVLKGIQWQSEIFHWLFVRAERYTYFDRQKDTLTSLSFLCDSQWRLQCRHRLRAGLVRQHRRVQLVRHEAVRHRRHPWHERQHEHDPSGRCRLLDVGMSRDRTGRLHDGHSRERGQWSNTLLACVAAVVVFSVSDVRCQSDLGSGR